MNNKPDYMFFNCQSLISLNSKNFDLSDLESNNFPNNNNNIAYYINNFL